MVPCGDEPNDTPVCLMQPLQYSQVVDKALPGNRPDVLKGEVEVLREIAPLAARNQRLLRLLDVFEVWGS